MNTISKKLIKMFEDYDYKILVDYSRREMYGKKNVLVLNLALEHGILL